MLNIFFIFLFYILPSQANASEPYVFIAFDNDHYICIKYDNYDLLYDKSDSEVINFFIECTDKTPDRKLFHIKYNTEQKSEDIPAKIPKPVYMELNGRIVPYSLIEESYLALLRKHKIFKNLDEIVIMSETDTKPVKIEKENEPPPQEDLPPHYRRGPLPRPYGVPDRTRSDKTWAPNGDLDNDQNRPMWCIILWTLASLYKGANIPASYSAMLLSIIKKPENEQNNEIIQTW